MHDELSLERAHFLQFSNHTKLKLNCDRRHIEPQPYLSA